MVKKLSFFDYIKIFIYGLIFMVVTYVLSGDTSSIVIGVLVMYLEYKFYEKVKK